jgi:hypothetical protein
MTISKIKVGKWYETKLGVGKCLRVGGTHPPSTQFQIVAPFPRGRLLVSPRDVVGEMDESTIPDAVKDLAR